MQGIAGIVVSNARVCRNSDEHMQGFAGIAVSNARNWLFSKRAVLLGRVYGMYASAHVFCVAYSLLLQ